MPSDSIILWILIIFLIAMTLAAIGISRIPGSKATSTTSPVNVFIGVFLGTLIGAFIIYSIVNLILKPILGVNEIAFSVAILYYIIIMVVIFALTALFYPGRVGIMA